MLKLRICLSYLNGVTNIMNINNKTILITGLLIGAIIATITHYEQLASTIFGGLIGYLAKDPVVEFIDGKRATDEILSDEDVI